MNQAAKWVVAALCSLLLLPACYSTGNETEEESPSQAEETEQQVADPYFDAINRAIVASEQTQTAKTMEEWQEVYTLWGQAIELLKGVPNSSDNYTVAISKVQEYESNQAYALRNVKLNYFNCDAIVPRQDQQSSRDIAGYIDYEVGLTNNRSEPQYIGLIGYLKTNDYFLDSSSSFPSMNWKVPVYQRSGPNTYRESDSFISHKTKVEVLNQYLSHQGFGSYSGVLEVRILDGSETSILINPQNFVPTAYWECPLPKALRYGPFVAEMTADAAPINRSGEWTEPGSERKVLCGTNRGNRGSSPYSIGCLMYRDYRYGYGGIEHFFNPEDLKIIY